MTPVSDDRSDVTYDNAIRRWRAASLTIWAWTWAVEKLRVELALDDDAVFTVTEAGRIIRRSPAALTACSGPRASVQGSAKLSPRDFGCLAGLTCATTSAPPRSSSPRAQRNAAQQAPNKGTRKAG